MANFKKSEIEKKKLKNTIWWSLQIKLSWQHKRDKHVYLCWYEKLSLVPSVWNTGISYSVHEGIVMKSILYRMLGVSFTQHVTSL